MDENASRPAPSARPWRGRLKRVAKLLVVLYLTIAIVIYAIQDQLIFPGHATQGQQQAMVRASDAYQLVHLKTVDGTAITAVFGQATDEFDRPLADSSHLPTILFFYGNAMCIADCMSEFQRFRRLGCNVIVPDYAGYGMSGGKPSEAALYATADAVYDYIKQRPEVDGKKIIAAGWSLGAAVAIDWRAGGRSRG